MDETPHFDCPYFLEDFTKVESPHNCVTCLELGTICRGLKHKRQNSTQSPNETASVLNLLVKMFHANLLNPSSTAPEREKNYKTKLQDFYKLYKNNDGEHICMFLNMYFPPELVIGAHLFPRSLNEFKFDLLGLTEIDDPRNGLVLFKPLEIAFDKFRISFIKNNDNNDLVLKIIDPTISEEYLINYLDNSQMKLWIGESKGQEDLNNIDFILRVTNKLDKPEKKRKKNKKFDFRTKFKDLEGKPINFNINNFNRPFNRCLNFQARLALIQAENKGIIQSGDIQFEDFWSDIDLLAKFHTVGFFKNEK